MSLRLLIAACTLALAAGCGTSDTAGDIGNPGADSGAHDASSDAGIHPDAHVAPPPDGGGPPPPDGGGPPPDGGPRPDGSMMMGPTPCVQQSDCTMPGACPPDAHLGCTCTMTPMGQACIPACNTDQDCPTPPDRMLMCNTQMMICVPR